jgi:hypothetical protein
MFPLEGVTFRMTICRNLLRRLTFFLFGLFLYFFLFNNFFVGGALERGGWTDQAHYRGQFLPERQGKGNACMSTVLAVVFKISREAPALKLQQANLQYLQMRLLVPLV